MDVALPMRTERIEDDQCRAVVDFGANDHVVICEGTEEEARNATDDFLAAYQRKIDRRVVVS